MPSASQVPGAFRPVIMRARTTLAASRSLSGISTIVPAPGLSTYGTVSGASAQARASTSGSPGTSCWSGSNSAEPVHRRLSTLSTSGDKLERCSTYPRAGSPTTETAIPDTGTSAAGTASETGDGYVLLKSYDHESILGEPLFKVAPT